MLPFSETELGEIGGTNPGPVRTGLADFKWYANLYIAKLFPVQTLSNISKQNRINEQFHV